jgi:hypothetical protein
MRLAFRSMSVRRREARSRSTLDTAVQMALTGSEFLVIG